MEESGKKLSEQNALPKYFLLIWGGQPSVDQSYFSGIILGGICYAYGAAIVGGVHKNWKEK